MGEIYTYQDILAFPESWAALISGFPEAQGEGDPAHSLVLSQMETPEGIQEEVGGKGKRLSGALDGEPCHQHSP